MPRRILVRALVLLASLAVLAGCGTVPEPGAPRVLYFVDGFAELRDPFVLDALWANGYLVRKVEDAEAFQEGLRLGGIDLAILLVQEDRPDLDLAAIDAFVDRGGRAIVADWRQDDGLAAPFEARYGGDTNLVSADLEDPVLGADLPSTLRLVNPGWNVFSMSLEAAGRGVSLCTFAQSGDSCLVLGNRGRTAILGFVADALPLEQGETFFRNLTALLLD
jgi:hypothetical protein